MLTIDAARKNQRPSILFPAHAVVHAPRIWRPAGDIPAELGQLVELKELTLNNNSLGGEDMAKVWHQV